MPDPKLGFTGEEIRDRIINFIGNDSDDFKSFIEQAIPMAEYRLFKLHDWHYLQKKGLALPVTNGTSVYELNSTNITELNGDESLSPDDVETIYNPDNNAVLRKVDANQIRRRDPNENDGTDQGFPMRWAIQDDKSIIVHPFIFQNTTLKLDARIQFSTLGTLTNHPTVPYRYQESFIEYLYAIALDRENDDRADKKKSDAFSLINQDIQDDSNQFGDVYGPRIRSLNEAAMDSAPNLNESYFFLYDWYEY